MSRTAAADACLANLMNAMLSKMIRGMFTCIFASASKSEYVDVICAGYRNHAMDRKLVDTG